MRKVRLAITAVFVLALLWPGTALGGTPPPAPTKLTVLEVEAGHAEFQWNDNSSDEAGFKVERAGDEAFTSDVRQFTVSAGGAATAIYTDNTILERTTYWYRVFAFNADGASVPSNKVKIVTPGSIPQVSLVRPSPVDARLFSGAQNSLAVDASHAGGALDSVEYQVVFDDPECFTAQDIFAPQVSLAIPATLAPDPTDDGTTLPEGLPAGAIAEFEIEGAVTAVDPARGEWRIGSLPVLVYESAATSMAGSRIPRIGDAVKIVARRSIEAGPLVAERITFIAPGPQPLIPALVSITYLYNGVVQSIVPAWVSPGVFLGGVTWTVGGEMFCVDRSNYPAFPAFIDEGLGIGSTVSVRFDGHGSTPNIAREIFLPQQLPVFLPTTHPKPIPNNDSVALGLPAGTWVQFIIYGVVSAVDHVNGEWRIGSQAITVYEHAGTTISDKPGGFSKPQVGDIVFVLAKRTTTAGPLLADQILLLLNGPSPVRSAKVEKLYLFNGIVQAMGPEAWTISGTKFTTNAQDGPAAIDPGVLPAVRIGAQVTVQFQPAGELLPHADLWAPLSRNASTGLWDGLVDLPPVTVDRSGVIFLRATDNVDRDDITVTVSATLVAATLPDPATDLTASALAPSQVDLEWTDNSPNESGFRVERAPDSGGVPGAFEAAGTTLVDVAEFSDTVPVGGATYYYRVYAFNGSGDSDPSNVVSIATLSTDLPGVPAPSSPADGAQVSGLSPRLEWTPPAGAAAMTYEVQVTSTSSFASPVVEAAGIVDPFLDIPAGSLSAGTTYRWHVRGRNTNGDSTWSRESRFRTPNGPPAPRLVAPSVNNLTPTLAWNEVAGGTYDVQVSLSRLFADMSAEGIGLAVPSFDVPPDVLETSRSYYWRVRVATETGTSVWALSVFRTPMGPTPPRALAPRGVIADLTPVLEWSGVSDAVSYEVQVSASRLFSGSPAAEGTVPAGTTTFDVPPLALQGSTMYFWRVRMTTDLGLSRWSAPGVFRTPFGPRVPPIPVAPRGIVNTLTPTLEWRILRDEATTFDVQLSTSVRFLEGTVLMDVTGIPAPVFTPGVTATLDVAPALSPGTIYYWRVRGVNEYGSSVWRLGVFRTAVIPL